jgi:LPS-assembly protein
MTTTVTSYKLKTTIHLPQTRRPSSVTCYTGLYLYISPSPTPPVKGGASAVVLPVKGGERVVMPSIDGGEHTPAPLSRGDLPSPLLRRTGEGSPHRVEKLTQRGKAEGYHIFLNTNWYYSLLITLFTAAYCLVFTANCSAEEQTIITSETLEYIKEMSTYIAKGNVKIQRADTIIEADEMRYKEQTSEIIAVGAVRYSDSDTETSITANRAELNLEAKTGMLYNAEIFYRKDNYRISGKEIEKKGDKYYFSPEATFTTCDGPVPAWCFRGKNIDAVAGEELKAKDVTFRIKDVPVFYTPYFRAAILTERQTGFLTPVIGYSKTRGAHLNTPFFWAISENRDATIVVDIYSKRGIGEGLEYRYIEPKNINGKWWLYHLRDNTLDKNFYELKALHEQRTTGGIGGFLNINLVNEKEFYREFKTNLEVRTNRFLESTGEITLPFSNSRVYLLSQYWIDLKENSKPVPQKLPEAGFILNPAKTGPFWFSATTTLSNFWRDEGVNGQRLDIYPRVLHKFGSDVVVLQTLGLRETAYSLHKGEDNSLHREAVEYSIVAHTRLLKKYESFTHVLEPSIGYTLITDSEDLPLFDSTELFKKTSTVELSLLNRFINNSGEFMVLRASQGFDSYLGDRPFLPLRLEIGIKKPISMRFDASYDVNTGRVESINSDLWMKVSKTTISAGQRYNRQGDILTYVSSIGLYPYKSLYMEGRLWYDAKEREVKDVSLNVKYTSQCWGVNLEFIKKPGDFTAAVMFELKGISKGLRI